MIKLPELAGRYPLSAVGRPAAARVARPRARAEPADPAARRAAVGARRAHPRGAARGNPRAAAQARHHDDLRHPRPGGGAVDLRPHRRDERGRDRAGRHAQRNLQPPAHPLRRFVRRHAQHSSTAIVVDPAEGAIRHRAASRCARAAPSNGAKAGRDAARSRSAPRRCASARPPTTPTRWPASSRTSTFLGAVVRLRVRLDQGALLVDAFNVSGAAFPERGQDGHGELRPGRSDRARSP